MKLRNIKFSILLLTKLGCGLIFTLLSPLGFAATGTVNTNADTAGTSQTGSLRQVINYINASGTAGSSVTSNTININNVGAITLGSDLPVIQKGVTIAAASLGQVIDGASSYRLFATFQSSLRLSDIVLSNGRAIGGTGIWGSGGGMGAGGGVYIDYGNSLQLHQVDITSCQAIGGDGGPPFGNLGGGGAAASWTIGTKNSVDENGVGDYPGLNNGGGAAITGPNAGYGGGNGGGAGAGIGGGTGAGGSNGGNGGYCGGGGGGGSATVFGSAGGNGGGTGGTTSGGGYGSGGAGGGGSNGTAGSGGGLGGGGGGARNGGGGGGGFGGGGGCGNGSAGGFGGSYAGNGGSNNTTDGGGGGAGIGGAIFVGDSATLYLSGVFSYTSNLAVGGAGGGGSATNGVSAIGPDIFLFRGANLTFNGGVDVPTLPDIYVDAAATGSNKDGGVTVSTSSGAIVTFDYPLTYQGNTTVTSGTLRSIGANLPGNSIGAPGNLIIQSGGTFSLTSGTFPTNTLVNNQAGGTVNLAGTFAPLTGSTIAGTLNINTGGSFTLPTAYTYTGTINVNTATTPITGSLVGGTGSTLNIGNSSSITYTTVNPITGIQTLKTVTAPTVFNINHAITANSNSEFNIATGTTVNVAGGASISDFNSLVVNGTLNLANGTTYTLDADSTLTGSGVVNNNGQFYINSSDVNFAGSFDNDASGTLNITGTPTINFSGSTFVNSGNLVTTFNANNNLPTINATNVTVPGNLDLSHGVIVVGYSNNYIASGNYTLLNAGTPPVPGVSILPQNTFYISDWSLSTIGNTLAVSVTRNGFDDHALTPQAVEIGAFLEQIGSGNPSASQLTLLNALEGIQNDAELTSALLSLLPPQYIMLVTLALQDEILGSLDIRLASMRRSYSSGDSLGNDKLGVWIRPFSSQGTQTPNQDLNGYTNKNHGFVFGLDRSITEWLTLGAAATYIKSTVNDTTQLNSNTNISTYQLMFYSTVKGKNDSYVDALISGGVSNYHAIRTITFPGFDQAASSNYSGQQLTLKIRASKIFNWADFWQFTPNVMAQYSFVRALAYAENGAGSYNIYVNPNNINLFRLGAGASLGIPFTSHNMISIPSVYAMVYDDVKGGEDTTNSQFLMGGPIITNSVHSGRAMLKLGAMYELSINKNLQFVVNYDYIVRHNFKGTEGLLNFRYIF